MFFLMKEIYRMEIYKNTTHVAGSANWGKSPENYF